MAKVVDIGSKRLISLAPNNWVQWVTQRSDILVKEGLEKGKQQGIQQGEATLMMC